MTENTYKLIEQFRPQSIDIPIDKCELEKVIETLVSLMFPICNCPDSREVQVELREAAEKLHANIASIHDREAADKKRKLSFRNYRHCSNDYTRMQLATCGLILPPRHWKR